MVPNTVRVAVGILGNAASMLLYTAPILTFRRVVKKGNVEEFSCVPYILALLNCLLYTWYGLPVVSSGWENLPVATINGLGILLEITFIGIYVWFAPAEKKRFALQLVLPVLALFALAAALSSFMAHTHHMRKVFVGSVGLVASISMYSSPMVAAKRVIATKSVEFMPFYLSLFSFLSSALWMIYGLLGRDFFIASPNFIGVPMGMLQLLLYCIYRRGDGATAEAEGNFDISQDDFSGPEAELRYRSLQVHMTAEPSEAAEELPDSEVEHEIPAQVDEPPPPPAANQNVSFRRRKRKQARPERAPFF